MKINKKDKIFKTVDVVDVANHFIRLSIKDENYLTPLKLNRLCYISYSFTLKQTGEKLFDNDIIAGKYGPIIPDLYSITRIYGNSKIKEELRR